MSQNLETEDELVLRAQNALSKCNWVIGECAARWTQKYARGRTDADFGEMISLSGDQVYQRRRVWETFADVSDNYPQLKWSHFYVALNWDDASECLQWANENEATVAEMRAWRRAQHGEDLTQPAEEDLPFEATGDYLAVGTALVRDPDEFAGAGVRREGSYEGGERVPTAMAAARESSQEPYAPFGKGARGPAPTEASDDKAPPSSEQILKKVCSTLEKVDAALTPEILNDFHDMPLALQQRLIDVIDNLQGKAAGLR